jgi:methylmalonyl-CoA mutase
MVLAMMNHPILSQDLKLTKFSDWFTIQWLFAIQDRNQMPGKSKIIPEVSLEKDINPARDFPSPGYDAWKAEAEKSLKGAKFREKLITGTYEGIFLRPIYHTQDIHHIGYLSNFPGFGNCVRGGKASGYLGEAWKICQAIPSQSAGEFNSFLQHDLSMGQNAINLVLDRATRMGRDSDALNYNTQSQNGLMVSHLHDLSSVLRGLDFRKYPIFIQAGYSSVFMMMLLMGFLEKSAEDFSEIKGCLEADPLGMMVGEGKLPVSVDLSLDHMAWCIDWVDKYLPGITTIGVDVSAYQDAGASTVMELAFALGTAVEYINQLRGRGLGIGLILPQIRFTFGIGPFFFMEIAKFRAARLLWSNVVKAYGGDNGRLKMRIHARTASHNQTLADPFVNVLRCTTGALSAIVSGIDSLQIDILGEFPGQADEFRRRIARNIQLILLHETHVGQTIDPAGGSFLVESLTAEIAEKSWKQFQDIERRGGMLQALNDGFPQEQVSGLKAIRDEDINRRRKGIVGTTRYTAVEKVGKHPASGAAFDKFSRRLADLNGFRKARNGQKLESHLKQLDFSLNSGGIEVISNGIGAFLNGATIGEVSSVLNRGCNESAAIDKIEMFSPSRKFEALKSSLEISRSRGLDPEILQIAFGNTSQVRGKVKFSRGLFEVAGLRVSCTGKVEKVPEALETILHSRVRVVVICADDDSCPAIVPQLMQGLKKQKPDVRVFLAGDPGKLAEKFREAGISEFVYDGVDIYQVLKKLMKIMEILPS